MSGTNYPRWCGTYVSTAHESRLPVKGKTVLTEISTNYSPIRLNFCTQPFLSMLPGLETTNTIMTMAMMAMAIVAVMAKLFN